jgi:nicotinamide-nucleotide amidase
MYAEILAVGTEITSGANLDTNSQWLSLELGELGIVVRAHITVDDTLEDIVAAIRLSASRSDVLLITGGLGPTLDDLTRDALAQILGVELALHPPSLDHVKSMFARRNRTMPERNLVQAMFPAGSEPLANSRGTAPGIFCVCRNPDSGQTCKIAALPGVPSEMKLMFHEQVVPRLDRSDQVIVRRRIHTFGMGESQVDELLGDLTARGRDPEVGITAHEGTISLRIAARGTTRDDCERKIEAARQEIRRCLGTAVFGEEDDELEHAVLRLLRERGQSLATVESGTGGLLAYRLTSVPDYETNYAGGSVTPSQGNPLDLKMAPSSVEPSAECAIEIALGCRRLMGTDFAISITDWPKYDAENPNAPVPIGYVGLCGDGIERTVAIHHFGDPSIAKSRTVKAALNLLRLWLMNDA